MPGQAVPSLPVLLERGQHRVAWSRQGVETRPSLGSPGRPFTGKRKRGCRQSSLNRKRRGFCSINRERSSQSNASPDSLTGPARPEVPLDAGCPRVAKGNMKKPPYDFGAVQASQKVYPAGIQK
jgi:hypothetical protein